MATEGYKRKISAILSADVAGYSRLMEEDETATVRTLEAYRKTIAIIIKRHRGRIIDSPGDNILSEFASVVDAVQCAVEIQQVIGAKNADLPENRKMAFRVGINLGDVIEEGDRIYGDGVNRAARIERIADPGSICISGSAYEQIKSKLALEYEDLGEHSVKNISEPVRVYRIPMDSRAVRGAGTKRRGLKRFQWVVLVLIGLTIVIGVLSVWNHFREVSIRSEVAKPETASAKKAAPSLTEQPSILVLPFDNMSGDPEQEYFVAGMVEEIMTKLSMSSTLAMVAGNSTFLYKGEQRKLQQIGEELRARYIVKGSLRKAGDQVRITAQLIDAVSGNHIWARTYDRELRDVFSLQDDVSQQIVSALNLKYTEAEQARVRRIPAAGLTAYDSFQRGTSHFYRYTEEGSAKARKMFQKAVVLDPEYALAYAYLGDTYLFDYMFEFAQGPQALENAFANLRRAISLDDSLSIAHAALANAYRVKGQIAIAMAEVGRAISLNPYDSEGYYILGSIHNTLGESEDALEAIQKAMRLNPHYPGRYLTGLAWAYRDLGKYKEAIGALNETLTRNPDWAIAYSDLAFSYVHSWTTQHNDDPQALDRALEMAERSVALNESWIWGHWVLSLTHLNKRQYDRAVSEVDKTIDPIQDLAVRHVWQALIYNYVGRSGEAIAISEKAIQSDPKNMFALSAIGKAYRLTNRYEDAIAMQKRVFSSSPNFIISFDAHIELAILFAELDRVGEAGVEAAEILEMSPDFSVDVWGDRIPYRDPAQAGRDMAALRKAGLK